MRSRRERWFKLRRRVRKQRRSNEELVASRGCYGASSRFWRSTNRFPAALVYRSLRSEACPAGEAREFTADFRADARGQPISLIGGCNRVGAGKQPGYRGGAISSANRRDRRHARRRRWVIARLEPASGRTSSRNWRAERSSADQSNRQLNAGASGELKLFRRGADYGTAE